MRNPLASVYDLAAHIGEDIESNEDIALADSMLRAASARVRIEGDDSWEDYNAPDIAIAVTLDAAARGYQNPAGYSLERGDMVTLQRVGQSAIGGTALTDEEKDTIRRAVGAGGVSAINLRRPDKVSDVHLHWLACES